jgi:hypothetical protein
LAAPSSRSPVRPERPALADWTCPEPGGLDLSVTARRAAISDPVKLDALLATRTHV